ncbi:MAG TPA: dienelactone hydrolase family protein [Candidatus Baltobacteraceae bacterium]|nr:dienelactone hydrolase family protein [Candidatus Baltobacteraceae bacterium]
MLKRSEFVGTAAGAALAVPALAQAAAAQLDPIPENNPDITVSRPTLDRDGFALPAYAAQPKNATAATPGVVVVLHIWGVDEQIRDTVRRFAKAGFAAIAPDLFARSHPPSGDGATDYTVFAPLAKALKQPEVDGDLRAAALWLKAAHPQSKIGVTGFCMGGAIALRQAIDNADVFSADAPWYGKVEGLDPAQIKIPLCGSYGGKDTGIPADGVHAFFNALSVPHEVVVYPQAGHAFFDHTRSSWVQSASEDAWNRVTAFFAKYLKSS